MNLNVESVVCKENVKTVLMSAYNAIILYMQIVQILKNIKSKEKSRNKRNLNSIKALSFYTGIFEQIFMLH